MIKNDFIRSRIMELKPVDSSAVTKKELTETLEYLFRNLYFFANLVVANCFEEYQNTAPADIPYLQGAARVKKMETIIQQWRNKAAECNDEKERNTWLEKVHRLTEIKRYYRRQVQKKIFAAECRMHSYLPQLMQRFPNIPYTVAFNTFFEVRQSFLNDWERVRESSRQLRQYQKGMPIYFGYDNNFQPFYIHTNQNGKEAIRFKWNIDAGKEMLFEIEFGRDKSENEKIIRTHIIGVPDGFKKLGDSFIQIDRRKNKIFLNQVFKLDEPLQEIQQTALNTKLVMGVDLGIKIPMYWALNNGNEAQPIGSKHKIPKLRSQFFNRINKLQSDLKQEGAEDKGQAGRMKALKNIRKKEREMVKQINRDMAKELIEAAKAKGAGTIYLEDIDFTERKKLWTAGRKLLNDNLTDDQTIKSFDSYYDRMLHMMRNWSYSQLIRFIREQAENNGIQVLFVDAHNTSLHCFICKEKGSRKKQEFLEVKKNTECSFANCPCEKNKTKTLKKGDKIIGYIHFISADKNAAFNIAINAPLVVPLEKKPIDWDTILKDEYEKMKAKQNEKKQNRNRNNRYNKNYKRTSYKENPTHQ